MTCDCIVFVKRCQVCQYHRRFTSRAFAYNQSLVVVCIMGNRYRWTTRKSHDPGMQVYSSCYRLLPKWAEAMAVRNVVSTTVLEFIRVHIIYQFGVPESITVDNGQPFKSAALYKLYDKYRIKWNHSSWYYLKKPSALYLKKWWRRIKRLGRKNYWRPCGLIGTLSE